MKYECFRKNNFLYIIEGDSDDSTLINLNEISNIDKMVSINDDDSTCYEVLIDLSHTQNRYIYRFEDKDEWLKFYDSVLKSLD